MKTIDVCIRYSQDNIVLDKVAVLTIEDNLIYKDEGENFRGQATTATKFAMVTAASPLIGVARIVRSAAFACSGDFNRAGREFVGGLTIPLVASTCLIGSLLSYPIYLIDNKSIALSVQMRRTYAYFEAWINNIDLHSKSLVSFSSRASSPLNFMGDSKDFHKHVWTTAPCMQPILERGFSRRGGLLDAERMKKIFPLIQMFGVHMEASKLVLQSNYENGNHHIVLCNGACEHTRSALTCCCFRIETAYDRVLCCQVGQGNCTSIANHRDTCGFIFCSAGCIGICCCTEKNNLVSVATCLI